MLKQILAVSGRPGLYKLLSRGKSSLIVESLIDSRRFPIHGFEKVISLGDISMYTDADDIPLARVLQAAKDKEEGREAAIDYRHATNEELAQWMADVLPAYDRARVHASDIRKLISWYNLLVKSGNAEFKLRPQDEEESADDKSLADAAEEKKGEA